MSNVLLRDHIDHNIERRILPRRPPIRGNGITFSSWQPDSRLRRKKRRQPPSCIDVFNIL